MTCTAGSSPLISGGPLVHSLSSALNPPVSVVGEQVCESVGNAYLLLGNFDSKQSRESVDLPLFCHPSPSLTNFAFMSSEVRRLLLDLDPHGDTDLLYRFPRFLKKVLVLWPTISV